MEKETEADFLNRLGNEHFSEYRDIQTQGFVNSPFYCARCAQVWPCDTGKLFSMYSKLDKSFLEKLIDKLKTYI